MSRALLGFFELTSLLQHHGLPDQRPFLKLVAGKKPVETRQNVVASELKQQFVSGIEPACFVEQRVHHPAGLGLAVGGRQGRRGDVAD